MVTDREPTERRSARDAASRRSGCYNRAHPGCLHSREEAAMVDSLTFHLCETDLCWVGLVLSSHGLRATTLPRDTRDEALLEVIELGATVPARHADLSELPDRSFALAPCRYDIMAR